jgi:ABC-type uncharacterized transport system substrate-binding protein
MPDRAVSDDAAGAANVRDGIARSHAEDQAGAVRPFMGRAARYPAKLLRSPSSNKRLPGGPCSHQHDKRVLSLLPALWLRSSWKRAHLHPGKSLSQRTGQAPVELGIVFMSASDPIADGLVTSLGRPAGNVTGVSFLNVELNPKRLELLSELVPQAKVIALLVNPNYAADRIMQGVQEAARAKAIQLQILKANTEGEIAAAFATLVRLQAGALLVGSDPVFDGLREQLVVLAARHAIPAIYAWRSFAASGGLISYGPNPTAVYRQLGNYTGRILRGAKPSDLPVEQPTKIELVINMKTAKALDLTIPPSILARADEVIE